MIDLKSVSACLITKDPIYPLEVLQHTASFPFGEILVLTSCDSPYRKYELFSKAKYDLIYYSDDDAICPIKEIAELSKPEMINIAMKPHHFEVYNDRRMSMGLGWGSIFHKLILKALDRYREIYGEDELFKRDTEKILTYLVYPQNRMVLPITDLPSAMNEDRLWRQPNHWTNMDLIEQRCQSLLKI
jgi:alpha-N-acetylglucosamine transferase